MGRVDGLLSMSRTQAVASSPAPERFRVEAVVGRGAQGQVLRATDLRLGRSVALKTVHPGESSAAGPSLMDEARAVARLSHPNIVPLFDALESGDDCTLVFEYVEGETVSALLKREGALPALRACQIAIDLLEALEHAHAQGVLHRDVKPANLMVSADARTRLMDFGVACANLDDLTRASGPIGSPRYMAPECFDGRFSAASDVYAVGAVLYEMLAGKPAFTQTSMPALMYAIANTAPPPLAPNGQQGVEAELIAVVNRALEKDESLRYSGARQMLDALKGHLEPGEATVPEEDAQARGALTELFRRMRHRSDFPALSGAIRAVNRLSASESESVGKLSDLLMQDMALMTKLLRHVNSAQYGHLGGISSISHAIMIMGFDTVRALALSMMLLEHLPDRAQAARLQHEMVNSLLAGAIGRELLARQHRRIKEQAFTAGVFRNLGAVLVLFYFPQECERIDRMTNGAMRFDDACAQVLGVTPQQVGTHAAKGWNMPEGLLRCMTALSQSELDRTDRRDEQHALRVATDLAVDLREIATSTPAEEHDASLSRLVKKYRKAWPESEQGLRRVVDAAMQPFLDDAQALRLDLSRMPGQIAQRWRGPTQNEAPASSDPQRALDNTFVIGSIPASAVAQRGTGSGAGARPAQAMEPLELGSPEPAAAIEAALQDALARVRGATAAGSVSERLARILGAMHQAMGFGLTVLALKDVRSQQVRPIVLEADDASAAADLKPLFEVDLDSKDELFALLAQRKTDVFIADAQADSVRSRLPRGLAEGRAVRSLLFMSLTLDGRTLGFIYADYGSRTAPNLPAAQLALLKSMRDEAVGAFRKRVA
ncbi:hypothetical protein IP84_13600 [beta proteobacterium AAP99]|nr:hypothetical protein IP84_13600 [beta proteobacterium AAP99]